MKTLNFVKMLLLCVITLSMTSCGDDNYYVMMNEDDKLCGRPWIDSSEPNTVSTYQLTFSKEGNKGQEITTTYDAGGKVIVDREFSWKWTDDSKEELKLTFADYSVKYFENVWVRDHYLSGKLNGKIVMMVDANYK